MSDREMMSSKYGDANSTCGQSTRTINYRDPVVERVVDSFVSRSDVGYTKYGRTLHQERTGGHKDLLGYLNDIQEELMDAVLYIQAAREEMKDAMQRQLIYDRVDKQTCASGISANATKCKGCNCA
jgi:hypothetical protein